MAATACGGAPPGDRRHHPAARPRPGGAAGGVDRRRHVERARGRGGARAPRRGGPPARGRRGRVRQRRAPRWPIGRTAVRPLPCPADGHRRARRAAAGPPGRGRRARAVRPGVQHPPQLAARPERRAPGAGAELCAFVHDERPRSYPAIVCGDLNAEPGSDEVRALTGLAAVPVPGVGVPDADRARQCRARATPGPTPTRSRREHEQERRIDHVLTGWRRNDGSRRPDRAGSWATRPGRRRGGPATTTRCWPSSRARGPGESTASRSSQRPMVVERADVEARPPSWHRPSARRATAAVAPGAGRQTLAASGGSRR